MYGTKKFGNLMKRLMKRNDDLVKNLTAMANELSKFVEKYSEIMALKNLFDQSKQFYQGLANPVALDRHPSLENFAPNFRNDLAAADVVIENVEELYEHALTIYDEFGRYFIQESLYRQHKSIQKRLSQPDPEETPKEKARNTPKL